MSRQAPNPGLPQVEFIIGDKDFTIPPNFIESFTYTDTMANTGDAFEIQLFDPTWELLDSDLFRNFDETRRKVQFRFGWGPDFMSKYQYGEILKITPGAVSRAGVKYTLTGADIISTRNSAGTPKVYQGKISDVVKQICVENGWASDVTETDDVMELAGRDEKGQVAKGQVKKTWQKGNMPNLAFVNYLAVRSISKAKPGNFYAWVDSSTSPPTLHFGPSTAHEKAIMGIYTFQTDRMGQVISFEPQVNAGTFTFGGLASTKVTTRDPSTRKVIEKEVTPTTFKASVATGKRAHVASGSSQGFHIPPVTEEEASARIGAYYDRLSLSAMEAQLTVIGDPTVLPNNYVRVELFTPAGKPYFTGGVYIVISVTHEISPGSYTTTLDLKRQAQDVGGTPHKMALASQVNK